MSHAPATVKTNRKQNAHTQTLHPANRTPLPRPTKRHAAANIAGGHRQHAGQDPNKPAHDRAHSQRLGLNDSATPRSSFSLLGHLPSADDTLTLYSLFLFTTSDVSWWTLLFFSSTL